MVQIAKDKFRAGTFGNKCLVFFIWVAVLVTLSLSLYLLLD